MSITTLSAGTVQALATRGDASRTAFQSVLVAAVHAVQRATERVRAAEGAALSLAQREKVGEVVADLRQTEAALRTGLDDQGRCILREKRNLRTLVRDARARVQASLQPEGPGLSWWFAFTEAVEALDEAASQVETLADAQPEGTPAGALGRRVADQFRAHHDALLDEADRWMVG